MNLAALRLADLALWSKMVMVKMYSQMSVCVPRFIISYFISIVWLWLYGLALGRCMAPLLLGRF